MKFAVALLLTLLAINAKAENIFQRSFNELHQEPPPPPAKSRANVQTLWITQQLDHFDETNEDYWNMRYMSNDEFYVEGAPLFIFVGGEWAISQGYIVGGHMYDMAREHNGYLFYTEHRYYGLSRPTIDITNENIVYLSVQQALADLAHFIRTQRASLPGASNSKVILVGGSYSATMVTWFKKLYPDLATGCWASSAPLHAQADFKEYKEVTGQSISLVGGWLCYARIEAGIREMENLFANRRGAEVKALLKLCNNFDENNDLDIWTLFSEISDIFAGLVQTHNDGNIQSACNTITSASDDLTGIAQWLFTRGFATNSCNDLTYKSMVGQLLESTYTSNIMRQWLYQTCNEYGWYQTSTSRDQPFGTKFPLLLYTTLCGDAYGSQFSNEFIQNRINATNTQFGSLNPEVENVYITHGQLDPWRAMGIQDEAQATIIPLHAHCKDFGSISDSDTAAMRASKEKIAELVREWVGSAKHEEQQLTVENKTKQLLADMKASIKA